MQYGIYVAYWLQEWVGDYKYYIDKVSKMGFDMLEISCAALNERYTSDAQLDELCGYAKDKGVALSAGYGPTAEQNIASADSAVCERAFAFFKELMPKLERLGIDRLGGGLYSYWPVDYSKPVDKQGDWARAVKNSREIAKYAADSGLTLNMEVLNRFEGYLLNTCEEGLAFVREVDCDNVYLMLDTFHMNIEEDNIAQAIRLAGKKLGHLHLGEQNRKVPGKGSIDWQEIGFALRDICYGRALVMEPFVLQGGTIASEIRIWHEPIPNITEEKLDRDALGALDFLRQVFEK